VNSVTQIAPREVEEQRSHGPCRVDINGLLRKYDKFGGLVRLILSESETRIHVYYDRAAGKSQTVAISNGTAAGSLLG
jgi:hypothetical protein